MFENKTEAQAREEILAMVAEYADRFHNQTKEFSPGDRIPYASRPGCCLPEISQSTRASMRCGQRKRATGSWEN